ncbi:MAG TPA: glycoside hydrolase family 2 protein [Polyangiaceae bacterium]|nr:glycoside hydrolase family 2 protein [Polyangiaceae bacterium]
MRGPWHFRAIPKSVKVDAAPLAAEQLATERALTTWMPAQVPGTVHTDLLAERRIDDPFVGRNERELQWIGERDWEYKTTLQADAALLGREHVELVFEGLDTYASVQLDGTPLLSTDNMFRTWRVPVKDALLRGRGAHELSVRFHSPLAQGQEAYQRLGHALPASNDLGTPQLSMFTRKAPYHYGWDWGPRLITSGIWRPVRLEAWDRARISELHVRTTSLSEERAELAIEAQVEASWTGPARLELVLVSGPAQTQAPAQPQRLAELAVTLTPGSQLLRASARLEHPQLWWPNGLGAHPLYTLEATLWLDSSAIDTRRIRIGLRTLEVEHARDADGKSFTIRVNGAPVFMKGANYIPLDSFPSRVSHARYEHVLRSAARVHMNMLRVWGGGIYEDDRFYDLCDELGILVWQDFMFACSMYPADPAFVENVREEARDNVRRLRHHPSLALWCGNNENEWAWHDWGWQERLPEPARSQVSAGHRRIFQELLPEMVRLEDPERFYTRSSPTANDDDVPPNQPGQGDMHYWGVWGAEEPYENYAKNVSRFMSEYGFQSFPEPASVARYAAPAERRLDSEVMRAHQRHPRGNQLIARYLERDFRAPRNFDAYLYVSQVLQAQVIQFAAEAHRRRMPYNGGSLYWQLDDCWPVASWSSIDYYGRWKALHFFARRFFAPVLVSSIEDNGVLHVHLVSDLRTDTAARLDLRVLDFNGREYFRESRQVVLRANSSQAHFEAPSAQLLSGADRRARLLVAELSGAQGLSSRSLHYFAKTKALALPNAGLRLERLSEQEGEVRLRISARRLARAVRLESSKPEGTFSDNYFDLLPGEARDVDYRGPRSARLELRSLRDTY